MDEERGKKMTVNIIQGENRFSENPRADGGIYAQAKSTGGGGGRGGGGAEVVGSAVR